LALPLTSKGVSIAIVLSTLALSALFLARGTTSLVAGMLFPIEAATASGDSGDGKLKKAPGTDPPDIHAILKRNAFDPTTGSLWPPKPAEVPVDPEGPGEVVAEELDPNKLPPACDQTVKLIASVYSERTPEWSFASLSNGTTPPLLYREGSQVADREVVSIYPSAVYMRQNNGKLCSLTLFVDPNAQAAITPNAPPPVAPAAEPVAAAAPAPGGTTSSEAELDAAISKVSDTQYTVKRAFVDKLLGNQAELMRAARIVPHEENGQVVGVKLYGIRRNSLLGKLGIQNGDLLKNINGMNMGSPDSALEAYSKLRSATDLNVAVTRRGQDMSLGFGITE
jgi:general secretion pathway protein C